MDSAANIVDIFLKAASTRPEANALIQDDACISYAGLLADVQRSAGGLRARGIGKGDAVLVLLPMSIELYTCVLALFHIGAVPVFLDAWSGRERLAACLSAVPCKGLIAPAKLLWLGWLFRPIRNIPIRCRPADLRKGDRILNPERVASDDTALVTFTTGSTGRPKAADRTHGFLRAQLEALRPILPSGQLMSFTTLPIVVLLQLAMGKTTVLPPARYSMKRTRSIRHLAAAIRMHQIEDLVVSPSVMTLLVDQPDLPSVRHIITGGGPVFPELARKIIRSFPKASPTIVFGSTEAEPISHIPAAEAASTDASLMHEFGLPVGRPDRAASVRIIPWQDGAIPAMDGMAFSQHCVPAGIAGEIVVSGAHVLERYINNREAEALNKIRVDGRIWHRTGDAGRLDSEGRLYFLGRCREMILLEDRTIFPVIVADRLSELPGVRGAALFQDAGQIVVVVEGSSGKMNEGIVQLLSEYGIKRPKVIVTSALPRDPRHLTKVDYDALRRKYSDGSR